MEELKTLDNTQEVNDVKDHTKTNNLATGFCLIGSAISIGDALFKVGKWVYTKIRTRKIEEVESEYIEETEAE